jgi:hypothetical protein
MSKNIMQVERGMYVGWFYLPACRQVGMPEKTCKATYQLAGKSTFPDFGTPLVLDLHENATSTICS